MNTLATETRPGISDPAHCLQQRTFDEVFVGKELLLQALAGGAALGLGGTSQTALDTTEGFSASASAEGGVLTAIWAIGNIIPLLACGIRRLHDTDRSGWWILISLIPLIGTIWLIVLMCLDGTSGRNRFGPDPKDRLGRAAEAVFE